MQRELFKGKGAMGPPAPKQASAGTSGSPSSRDDAESSDKWAADLGWDRFFASSQDLAIPNTNDVFRVYSSGPDEGPLFVLLHGGGHSALSWAATVGALQQTARVLAFDFRGHGHTRTSDDSNLSIETLTSDVITLISTLYSASPSFPIILVGHSLGGSVAIHAAISGQIKELSGLIVLDVVEGTAMASLNYMDTYLAKVPSSFPTLEKAIQWTVRSGSVHNLDSARVSVPPRLVRDESTGHYAWRTNLNLTKHYWEGWYQGLSKKFLSCPAAKVLVLAGTDRLDTELMIGQMQGKFRVVVLADCGHCIQEDNPDKTAEILLDLKKRYDIIHSKNNTIPRLHE